MPTLYGLTTCDTCRKARNWLQRFGIEHVFVDLRQTPQAPDTFVQWKAALGSWDALINKSSTTWRSLPPARKQPGSDAEWTLLLREHPALVKRPLVVLDDGRVANGFSDSGFKKLFEVVK